MTEIKTLDDQFKSMLEHEMKVERDPRINGKTLKQRKRQRENLYS